jgi:hypothetical protein
MWCWSAAADGSDEANWDAGMGLRSKAESNSFTRYTDDGCNRALYSEREATKVLF